MIKWTQYLISGIICCFSLMAHAQLPDSTWIKTYGGNRVDKGMDIIETNDGGYMIIGTTSSFGLDNAQMYFLKLDSNGAIEWSKNYGGPNQEWGHAVIQTDDGGYLGVGYTNSYGNGGFDAYLVKLSVDGSYQYEKTLGGNDWDFAYNVTQISQGKYAIVGETKSQGQGNSDAWIFMFNELTDSFEWERTFGETDNDVFNSVIINHKQEIVAAGGAVLNGEKHQNIIINRFSTDGTPLSSWNYGDTLSDFATDIMQMTTGDYACTGQFSRSDLGEVMSVFKADTLGNEIYHYHWGEIYDYSLGTKILELDSQRTAIMGFVEIYDGNNDFFFAVSYPGNQYYDFGGRLGSLQDDFGRSAIPISTGFMLVGYSNGFGANFDNVLVYKTNDRGVTNSNDYEVITDSVNITSTNNTLPETTIFEQRNKVLTFPHPEKISRLEVYNLSGALVYSTRQLNHQVDLPLPMGTYIISLWNTVTDRPYAQKLMIK